MAARAMKVKVRLGPGVAARLSYADAGPSWVDAGPRGASPAVERQEHIRVQAGSSKGELMVELPDNTPIRDLVKGLGISSPEYLLVIVNGHVPPADTPLSDGDQVMIVYPLSGG